jgi:adenine C2-methylase RlmN of 23S rRNA A2503 and tRNA A37
VLLLQVIVSTVGLLPQLRALRASGKAKLAVSLHATTDEVRDWIVPTNRCAWKGGSVFRGQLSQAETTCLVEWQTQACALRHCAQLCAEHFYVA